MRKSLRAWVHNVTMGVMSEGSEGSEGHWNRLQHRKVEAVQEVVRTSVWEFLLVNSDSESQVQIWNVSCAYVPREFDRSAGTGFFAMVVTTFHLFSFVGSR